MRSIHGLVLAVCFLEPAVAAAAQWAPIGPDGGDVSAVVVAPNGRLLYAAAGGALFRSANRGRSWTPTTTGLLGGAIDVQMGTSSTTVYALTTQGVFASFDGALTWSSRNQGLPNPSVAFLFGLTVVPRRPSAVFLFANQLGLVDLYRSLDSGLHWSRMRRDLPDIASLVPHPTDPQVIYARTDAGGIYRSTDTGAHWSPWSLAPLSVFALAVDAKAPDRLYAVAARPSRLPQLYVTTNGGRSWTVRHTAFDVTRYAVLFADPTRAGTLLVVTDDSRLFRTTDAGLTWSEAGGNLDILRFNGLAFDPAHPGVLYAAYVVRGLRPGLFQSVDGGATFHPSATGIQSAGATVLVPDPTTPGALYVGTDSGGLLRYAGGTWTYLGLEDQSVNAVAVDPAAPATIYASVGPEQVVYGTTDGGVTWNPLSPADGNGANGRSLAVIDGVLYEAGYTLSRFDPRTTSWATLAWGNLAVVAGAGAGGAVSLWCDDTPDRAAGNRDDVILSTDTGASFKTVLEVHGLVQAIALAPHDPQRAIVTWYTGHRLAKGGVFVTRDGGATWTSTAVAADAPPVFGAAFDPADPMHLVVASSQVFASRDGGATWSPESAGFPQVGAGAVAFANDGSGRLYAIPEAGGVYVLTEP
ncbi:MAG TPA: hypothetical protein VGE98_14670 [Thermoanaerobaculia bacterium]